MMVTRRRSVLDVHDSLGRESTTKCRVRGFAVSFRICDVFSRIDSFLKKECTGRTRLMRKGIYTEKTRKSSPTARRTSPTERPSAESAKRPARTAATGITAGGT